ncbi:hypothetical protein DAPPUDRAFT_306311 [Daphnia pulex]|uniref:Uncharacterized protein n=1 Tax=Daphnia pulex TaxID=6669 RepID=E9GWR2_DAPPU|nr:hypothetical protein DAPPUDRAFT_306311 [Daphnia pulex]|eukprot:EFX75944.1 hypothetical protein DAPPUDRAFT_306311 [Daphnia pulex]
MTKDFTVYSSLPWFDNTFYTFFPFILQWQFPSSHVLTAHISRWINFVPMANDASRKFPTSWKLINYFFGGQLP